MAERRLAPGARDGPGDHRVAVLRARARALAKPPAPPDPVDSAQLVVLAASDRRYAVPADRVVEVLSPAHTILLPRRGHELAGARVRRADLLPVADPGRATGGRDMVGTPDDCFVVVLDGDEPLGLLAHSVTTTVASGTLAEVVGAGDVVRGVTAEGVVVLVADVLLADPRFRVMAR